MQLYREGDIGVLKIGLLYDTMAPDLKPEETLVRIVASYFYMKTFVIQNNLM